MPVVPISQLQTRATQVKNEIAAFANSSSRVGSLLLDIVDTLTSGAGTGDVVGPGSSITGHIAEFGDPTGQLLADTGYSVADILALIPPSSVYLAGDGLSLTLQTFAVVAANATLVVSGAGVARAGITGDVTVAAGSNTSVIGAGVVTNAQLAGTIAKSKLEDSIACSLVGRSANTSGPVGDIAAGTNGFVFLRRSNVVTSALLIDENWSAVAGDRLTGAKVSPDFVAQDITTTGNVLLGPAATRPSSGLIRIGGSWVFNARNSAAVDVGVLTWDNATNILLVGGSAGVLKARIQGSSNIELNIAGTTRLVLGAAAFLAFLPELGWDNTVALPVLNQQATVSATGQLMSIHAQNAATTGGALSIASGTGGTTAGDLSLKCGSVTSLLAAAALVTLGSTSQDVTLQATASAGVHVKIGATDCIRYVGNAVGFDFLQSHDAICIGGAGAVTLATAGGVCNVGLVPGSINPGFQSGVGILMIGDRTTAPTGNATAGFYHWSDGGVPSWRSGAGNILLLNMVSSAGGVMPAVTEYMSCTYNGNARKIPLV